MTFLDEATWRGKAFSGGWKAVPAARPRSSSRPPARSSAGPASPPPADVAARGRGRRGGPAGLGRDPAHRAVRHPAPGRRHLAGARGRDRGLERSARAARSRPAAQFETHVATEEIYEAATLPSRPYGELLPSEQPQLSWAERVPVGVVGVISPFNFPQILAIRSVAPGARAGQRGGAQARPAHRGVRRRGAGPGLRGGRPARGPAARAARRRGRRRGADHRPAGAGHLVHRLHRGGPPRRRAGRRSTSSGCTWNWAATPR